MAEPSREKEKEREKATKKENTLSDRPTDRRGAAPTRFPIGSRLIRGGGVEIIFSVCVRRLEVGIKSMMPQTITKWHVVAKSTGIREPKDFVLPGVSIKFRYNGETFGELPSDDGPSRDLKSRVKVATQPSCLYLLGALWPEQT
jgi:hypothetical protein